MKKNFLSFHKNTIDKTLEKLSTNNSTPKIFFVLLLIIQLTATVLTSRVAGSKTIINFLIISECV